ncbi:MAG: DUF2225 domain-containing protein [Proteobacteria bacterium]|nr:DUF2225 domain-containing protein [Pseudomonadota bacterium]
MTTIAPRSLTCPICSTSLDGWLVMASASKGPLTTDLRRYDDGEDPIPKMVNGCPGCGYTGEANAFEELAPAADLPVPAAWTGAWFSQEEFDDAHDVMFADRPAPQGSTLKQQLEEHLQPHAAQAAADPALRWEHHAQVTRWQGTGPLREGDAWLRAAWMHGDGKAEADDLRCRRRALHCYRKGITEKRWFSRREDLVIIAYLVGELNRRLGDSDEALKWYEQATAWSSGLQHLEDLIALAERQGRNPRDVV